MFKSSSYMIASTIGIFSLLVIIQITQFALAILSVVVRIATDETNITPLIFYVLNSFLGIVCTPLIQCYFRRDLWETICHGASSVKDIILCNIHRHNKVHTAIAGATTITTIVGATSTTVT